MGDPINKTILVVEDEPDVQLFLKTILEDAGFYVMTADNGKHALERIKEKKPDLISLDLVMPKMRGVKLLSYLQKNPEWAKIPFIIVTAHAGDELGKEDFMKLKADKVLIGPHSYIEKPVVPSEYVKKIKEALGFEKIDTYDSTGKTDLENQIKNRLKIASKDKLEEALKVLGQ
ncbi:MAG: response regulator [Thermodesulfobacteriota bacterium]|nr:response regulator [Thermodesulfobacteriota bacterium]